MRILLILMLFASTAIASDESFGTLVCSNIRDVYDGDTIRCDIDTVHPLLGRNIGIRIRGIDTPEMKDKRPDVREKAVQAKMRLHGMLKQAKRVELRSVSRDKYFRILAEVWADGVPVADVLLQEGLARPYDGGAKDAW